MQIFGGIRITSMKMCLIMSLSDFCRGDRLKDFQNNMCYFVELESCQLLAFLKYFFPNKIGDYSMITNKMQFDECFETSST